MRAAHAVAALVLVATQFGCFDACGDPKELTVTGDYRGEVVVNWRKANAMGLYFTQPDASVPDGPSGHVNGYSYWVVEATDFPDGFSAPVVYGSLPGKSKDATEEHGGVAGGEPLECGIDYKVTVVSLGGVIETMVRWECE